MDPRVKHAGDKFYLMNFFAASRARRSLRMILPVAVIGRASMNSTSRGYSCAASLVRTWSWMARVSAASPVTSGLEHDEGLDRFGAHRVGHADHGGHRDRGVAQQALLDLGGADAIAGRGDHVIGAALVPEIPSSIALAHVAGQQPVADEFGACGLGVVPVVEEHHRIGPANGDLADLAVRHLVARRDRRFRHRGRERRAHRARMDRHERRAIADHEIAFGLAVELVDRDAERRRGPSRATPGPGSRRRCRWSGS